MGVYTELIDVDDLFRSHRGQVTILNDVQAFTEEDHEKLNKLIMTTYSGDLLTNIPRCECERITGAWNLGVLCPDCHTRVVEVLGQDLMPVTWIRAPKGVRAFINLVVWGMLKEHFTIGGFSLLNWMTDSTYHSNHNKPEETNQIENTTFGGAPFVRSYNYFCDNFFEIISFLANMKRFKTKRERSEEFFVMFDMYPNCIFSQYLPIPHRSLLVLESNNTGSYMDPISHGAIDAVLTLAGIDSDEDSHQLRTRENRTSKTIDQLSEFNISTYSETFASKEGTFRKHVYATRSHWSFRAVVSSLTDPHDYGEIHIPWGVATSVFRIHLINKLLRMDYTANEAISFINAHASTYHPLLDALFKELIAEAPSGRGIACTLGRNPSLHRSSIQLVYITQVKVDVDTPTVSMSILIVKGLNADMNV